MRYVSDPNHQAMYEAIVEHNKQASEKSKLTCSDRPYIVALLASIEAMSRDHVAMTDLFTGVAIGYRDALRMMDSPQPEACFSDMHEGCGKRGVVKVRPLPDDCLAAQVSWDLNLLNAAFGNPLPNLVNVLQKMFGDRTDITVIEL